MSIPLPGAATAVKLAALAVHIEEFMETDNFTDGIAIHAILQDPGVVAYLDLLRPIGLLPIKR